MLKVFHQIGGFAQLSINRKEPLLLLDVKLHRTLVSFDFSFLKSLHKLRLSRINTCESQVAYFSFRTYASFSLALFVLKTQEGEGEKKTSAALIVLNCLWCSLCL